MATFALQNEMINFAKGLVFDGRSREADLQFDMFIQFYKQTESERVAAYDGAVAWYAAYKEAHKVEGEANDVELVQNMARNYSKDELFSKGQLAGANLDTYCRIYADRVAIGDATIAASYLLSVKTCANACLTIWAAIELKK